MEKGLFNTESERIADKFQKDMEYQMRKEQPFLIR